MRGAQDVHEPLARSLPLDRIAIAGASAIVRNLNDLEREIAPGVVVKFKDKSDADACRTSLEGGGIEIDASGCQSSVRITMQLDDIGSWLVHEARRGAACILDVDLALGAAHASIQWAAFLTRTGKRVADFWKKISEALHIRGEVRKSWRLEMPSNVPDDATSIVLSLQLAPRTQCFRLKFLGVKPVGVRTQRGGLVSGDGALVGWLTDSVSSASVAVSCDDKLLGSLPVDLRHSAAPPVFSFELRDVAQALGGAGGHGQCTAALISEGSIVGEARFVWPPAMRARRNPPGAHIVSHGVPANAALFLPIMPVAYVARQPARVIADALLSAPASDAGRHTMREFYFGRHVEALWRVRAELQRRPTYGLPVHNATRAHVEYYYGRSLLDLNAAESAHRILNGLISDLPVLASLGSDEAAKLDQTFIRACVRSGRTQQAESAVRRAIAATPDVWELHFSLATLVMSRYPKEAQGHFAAAMRLSKNLPAPFLSFISEVRLAHGDVEGADELVTKGLVASPGHPELMLAHANVCHARGDEEGWLTGVSRFFMHYSLPPPPLTMRTNAAGIPWLDKSATRSTKDAAAATIAVIMTAFNAEQYIASAIESVLAQSFRDFRLVVVDDVSTDGTAEIVRALAARDSRVTLVQQERNGGTYVAKNRAIQETQAAFYTFHDSDDWMHPHRLRCHLDFARENPAVLCSVSNWIRVDLAGRVVVRRTGGYVHENPASLFLSADAIAKAGYFDSVRTGADSEFIWRLRRRFGRDAVRTIDLPLAIGLSHGASLTKAGAAAFDEHRYSPVRVQYWEAWAAWHRELTLANQTDELRVPFPLDRRRFSAPQAILP